MLRNIIGTGLALAISLAQVHATGVAVNGKISKPLVGSVWINTTAADQARLKQFKGRVTVLHYWTFGCINCRHNLPSIASLAKRYAGTDVQVIGVHTPETPGEASASAVTKAVKRLGITYPVLVDQKETNWNNYGVQAWPTIFVIDKQGRIQRFWEGELNWNGYDGLGELTTTIERLRQSK